jgi:alpha-beta hydrolase superfamily lysophospholipase
MDIPATERESDKSPRSKKPAAPSRRRRWLVTGAVCLVSLFIAGALVSYCVAYRLTRRARPPYAEPAPAVAWAQLESHRLQTRDGHEIGAWLGRGKEGHPAVLVIHSNGGGRRNSLTRAEIFARQGYSVLLISLRAHGDSTGEINDFGLGARNDVLAAVEFLRRTCPGAKVIVHGSSPGAASAVFAARDLGDGVAGYILESPFRDLKTAVRNRTENHLPPVFDALAYYGLASVSSWVLDDIDAISPMNAIDGIPASVPVLIVAGDKDRRARPEEARALHQKIQSHCRLVMFENTDHVRFLDVHPERFRRLLLEFAESCRSADGGEREVNFRGAKGDFRTRQ